MNFMVDHKTCTQLEIRYIYTVGIIKSERLEKKVYSVYLYYKLIIFYTINIKECGALRSID